MWGQAQEICCDADLPIAVVSGANANHRNSELMPCSPGQLTGNMLQHEGKTTCFFQGQGLFDQPVLTHWIQGLASVPQTMHRLRRQAQVTHDRDAHSHQPVHHSNDLGIRSLQFHRRGGGFFEQFSCGGHRKVWTALIAKEGQVTNEQRLLVMGCRKPSGYSQGVMQHLIEGDWQRCGMAQRHHPQRITHQNHVGPSRLNEGSRQAIPSRQHGDWASALLETDQVEGTHETFALPCITLLASQ
jgi:hypothetical protein